MNDIMERIAAFVKDETNQMTQSRLVTLKALLFAGYKGEREEVLIELIKTMDEKGIAESVLIESFVSSFEDEPSVVYWRIKPEFFRAVRKNLSTHQF